MLLVDALLSVALRLRRAGPRSWRLDVASCWPGMLLLRIAHKPERFLQTVTAVLGFQLVLAPLLIAQRLASLSVPGDRSWQLPS